MVEEFILEPAKESLHRRVVRTAPLPRHRPGQVVLLTDRDPSGPAVMAPADALLSVKSNSRVRSAFS